MTPPCTPLAATPPPAMGRPTVALGPAIAIHHVEPTDARQRRMGEIAKEVDAREPGQRRLRAQQRERADRIGAPPRERRAALGRQRFRQNEEAVKRVDKTEACRDLERQPWIDRTGEPAQRRAEHEADPETGA